MSSISSSAFGLYVHIPFCAQVCHYCDFAKTANFTQSHTQRYFEILGHQLKSWLAALDPSVRFTSVFFGGGTPGLFVEEYRPLFEQMKGRLTADCEVTLEANPKNVTPDRLKSWRDLGFNRISIGVQSFDADGLKKMTRDHASDDALRALEQSLQVMPHVNADLIYGWPGQTDASWEQDILKMTSMGVHHLSLYALTYEGRTPFARAERRGSLIAMPDDLVAERYETACRKLSGAGYDHEEISNWSKPGHSCRHNWLYWTAEHFVGLGAGAHGFVPSSDGLGRRYSYPGDLREYLRSCGSAEEGLVSDHDRDVEAWLMEYVGCALRCERGVELSKTQKMGFTFQPSPRLMDLMNLAKVSFDEHKIRLPEKEWFRETAWSGLVLEAFKK